MHRRLWLLLGMAAAFFATSQGCGDSSDTGPVQRSEAAIKSEKSAQDAMRAAMQSKKGGRKDAARKP